MYSNSDSDDDTGVDQNNSERGTLNLTGILFGNIDSDGKLVDDGENAMFGPEIKEHLHSLSKVGFGFMVNEVIENEKESAEHMDAFDALKASYDNEDGQVKSEDAVDFSDITELSEDCEDQPMETDSALNNYVSTAVEDDKGVPKTNDDVDVSKGDNELMPPPSAPILRSCQGELAASSHTELLESDEAQAKARKLDTPLADMLPSKYANTDVRELFPEFRQGKVLRFARLFGCGKPSSLPQIWRHVRKTRKRRKLLKEKTSGINAGSDSPSDSDEPRRKGFGIHYAPDSGNYASDDEEKLLSDLSSQKIRREGNENSGQDESKQKVADWRYGPAQIWYDLLDVPDSGDGFNYGIQPPASHNPKIDSAIEDNSSTKEIISCEANDQVYLMLCQLPWEDEVVWDGNDIKAKVNQTLNSKNFSAGWLPSSVSRTAGAFSQPGKTTLPVVNPSTGKAQNSAATTGKQKTVAKQPAEAVDDTWYSLFPVENEELIYTKWEDDIIFDVDDMPKIPKPKVLTLDPNDENIILGIPDDVDPTKINKNTGPPPKIKIPHPHVKKSKILLGKAGVINVLAEDTPPPPPKSPDRDPFNISDDSYYTPKTEPTLRLKAGGGNLIQHSTPVVELQAPFVPTFMDAACLRAFHRPALKCHSGGSINHPQAVNSLLKHIAKKSKQREMERIASGGGDVFFMRHSEDLSGRDGDIILAEFCEEHPPLMNQVGMCSKIKNYYKRKAEKDCAPQNFAYGELALAHTSPFLGILQPGNCIQALENNMYRAPIYPHKMASTDFLIIRHGNSFWVRNINALFTVGQECPLYEVPGPNSKRANNFTRDFLQVFIYRLFWKSRDHPRRIRMDDIKRAFPAHSESSIRKRLKQCADFKRTGMDSNWWVIKLEFRLPSEEEIRSMVSPEQCCAYFSMISAEQRLKDAGYGEKSLFTPQEDDDEEAQLKLEDEVKVAPWNTTRAYIQAMRGKCLLQLTGVADPTGCGEGFSYVRVPNKPTQSKDEQESQPKRTVTGTDADLRRLPLQRARDLLRKFKVPEEEIKKLTRWEVIDVVRTLSTEKAKAGEEGMDKFSRGNRFSIAEHQERYKEECQRIFDLQNRVLASAEVLSTDEGESSASEESDLEELGKNLENMLDNKKTSTQLSMEREEQERQELLKKILQEGEGEDSRSNKIKDDLNAQGISNQNQGRVLKISRVFKNSKGMEYTRVELVRNSAVIDAYVNIRKTKDETFIKQFATLDEQQKEEMKREKRRIQEQLRRLKRNQERERLAQLAKNQNLQPGGMPTSLGDPKSHGSKDRDFTHKEISPSRKKTKLKPDLKLKCGACGQVGHMRTNKACPLYTGPQLSAFSSAGASDGADADYETEKEMAYEEDEIVNVEGTKVTLINSKIPKPVDDKMGFSDRYNRDSNEKRKRRAGDPHCDYLYGINKTTNRRCTDPLVVFSSMLEQILLQLRSLPTASFFLKPVVAKIVPDYYNVVTRPMDLQTIRENTRQRVYHNREIFLADINQIVENSIIYNGQHHHITNAARDLLKSCSDLLSEKDDKLMRLEKAINPLLDDDDHVSLSFIFRQVLSQIENLGESVHFRKPVNKKAIKGYYDIIRHPMDLETMGKHLDVHRYHSRKDFLRDFSLIAKNSETFNGAGSPITVNAKYIVEFAESKLREYAEHCEKFEQNIAKEHEKACADVGFEDQCPYDSSDEYRTNRASSSPDHDNSENEIQGCHRNDSTDARTMDNFSQQCGNLNSTTPASEIKRGRGRPRKQRDIGEDAKLSFPIKRGRGRPRKGSLASNLDGSRVSNLEEDLQCSSDEDDDHMHASGDDESSINNLDHSMYSGSSNYGNVFPFKGEMKMEPQPVEVGEQLAEDGSQQAAEAMVQLGSVGFYTQQQQDDFLDVDPNYDPSDFLKMNERMSGNEGMQNAQQQMQLQPASAEFHTPAHAQFQPPQSQSQSMYADYMIKSELEPAYGASVSDHHAPTEHPQTGDMGMVSHPRPNDSVRIDDDLAISESDEDEDSSTHRAHIKQEMPSNDHQMDTMQPFQQHMIINQHYLSQQEQQPLHLGHQQNTEMEFDQAEPHNATGNDGDAAWLGF